MVQLEGALGGRVRKASLPCGPGPLTHAGTSFLRAEPRCVTRGERDAQEGSVLVALLSPGQVHCALGWT